jgi:hypothetical protein
VTYSTDGRRRPAFARGNERVEVRSTYSDRIDDANVWQFAPFTQAVAQTPSLSATSATLSS